MTDDNGRRVRRRTAIIGAGSGIGIGVLAFVAACSAPGPPGPSTSATPTGRATGPTTWAELAAAVGGRLLRPDDAGFATAKLVENPRYDGATPLGILRARDAADVAAGIAFARNSGTPMVVRSGGHNYSGWSAGGAPGTDVPPSLVVSTAGLDDIHVDSAGTLTVGPGAPLAAVYEALDGAGRAIGAGSCATVAIGGLTLGGGIGVLARSFGLTCDQLTGAEVVTADGAVHTVDAASTGADADLFWACRGGGGGAVGIVTSLTFRTQAAPAVSMFDIVFPWSGAAAVTDAWQRWAPDADPRLWSSLHLLGGTRHPSGPTVTVSGTWTGAEDALQGMLDTFVQDTGVTPSSRPTPTRHTYGDAMARYAGCAGVPAARCTTGSGGVLQRSTEAATSSIGTRSLTTAEIATLLDAVTTIAAVPGMTEGGVALDALGGAVAKVGATDTAFPHRSARCTAQYTATFAASADPAPFDAAVRAFRDAMTPAWGDGAYVNYTDAALADPAESYFGVNRARLERIRAATDAGSFLRQPHFL